MIIVPMLVTRYIESA